MRFGIVSLCLLLMITGLPFVTAQEPTTNEITIPMPNPTNLDPVSLSRFDITARDVVENLFIGLTRINARTGQVEPWLAESWDVSADGLTWTFTLRDDVQWVNYNAEAGEAQAVRPVTAGDVVFAVQRACDPERPSPITANLFLIDGCRPLVTNNSIRPADPQRVSVQAVDDTTLQIQLLFPASYFLTITALPEMRPLPPEFINDSVGNYPRPGAVVTSGAWVVSDWQAGTAMRLERNPFWEGEFAGNIEAVNLRFDAFLEAVPNDFANGIYDVVRFDPNLLAVEAFPAEALRSGDGNTLTLLGFSYANVNMEGLPIPSPLDFPEVRRALALALDREGIANAVYGNNADDGDHLTPRSVMGAPSSPGASFDPVTARELLAQVGYASCANMGQLPVAVTNDPLDFQLAQNIVLQWQINLGCAPEVFPITQTTRTALLDSAHNTVDVTAASRFPLWILSWTGDYPDAQAWVADALHCDYGYLRVGRSCDLIDTQLDYASTALNIVERASTYNQIESQLFGSQGSFPIIPLAVDVNWWAQQPWLSQIASYGAFQFDRWVIDRGE